MNVFHYVCVFLGHQAWVFIVVIRQGLDKVMFSCMHHHYVSKKKANPGHSSWTKCCTKAEGNINTNKDFCLPTGAPAAPWAPASQKKSSQTFILEGSGTLLLTTVYFFHTINKMCTPFSMCACFSIMHAYVSIHDGAWLRLVCIYAWAWLRIWAHTCKYRYVCGYV
jgi:hypothetical protein